MIRKGIMMNTFWDVVTQKVQINLSISNSQLMELLQIQEDEIVEVLTYNCYAEDDANDEISSIKLEILKLYSERIAKSISKLEVYEHNLPAEIVEALFELVQEIVGAELTEGTEERKQFYKSTCQYAYFINHYVELLLCEQYLERIKLYKRQLRNFNTKGLKINESLSFYNVSKKEYTKLKKKFKELRKVFRTYLIQKKDIISIRYSQVEREIGLTEYVSELENHILFYEEYYPRIVHNGYHSSFSFRAFRIVLYIIAILLSVATLLKYLNILDLFGIIRSSLF